MYPSLLFLSFVVAVFELRCLERRRALVLGFRILYVHQLLALLCSPSCLYLLVDSATSWLLRGRICRRCSRSAFRILLLILLLFTHHP